MPRHRLAILLHKNIHRTRGHTITHTRTLLMIHRNLNRAFLKHLFHRQSTPPVLSLFTQVNNRPFYRFRTPTTLSPGEDIHEHLTTCKARKSKTTFIAATAIQITWDGEITWEVKNYSNAANSSPHQSRKRQLSISSLTSTPTASPQAPSHCKPSDVSAKNQPSNVSNNSTPSPLLASLMHTTNLFGSLISAAASPLHLFPSLPSSPITTPALQNRTSPSTSTLISLDSTAPTRYQEQEPPISSRQQLINTISISRRWPSSEL